MKRRYVIALALSAFALTACETTGNFFAQLPLPLPVASDPTPNSFIAATAHPHATDAAVKVLSHGGTAIDAAVAVQMVLTLTEPESSGIGGGAFLLTYDPATGNMIAYDGRETAPASTTPDQHIGEDGKPLPFFEKVLGGKSVGVPGVVAMLAMAHEEGGALAWEDLFGYAIRLAEEGFEVSPKLHNWLVRLPTVQQMPDMKAYFTVDGVPHSVGKSIKNPEYAATLRKIAAEGPQAFYEGEIPQSIIAAAAETKVRPATLTEADFAAYEPVKRKVICAPYRVYKICSMPPPSSGGTTILQIMQMLGEYDMKSYEPGTADYVHLLAEASRLAYADRDRYIADPDFVSIPTSGLINAEYVAERAKVIDLTKSMGKAKPGIPPEGEQAFLQGDDNALELPSTSHFSIIDDRGFAISMTTSIEFAFGSHLMASGFLLNNQLTDFSAVAEIDGEPVANRPEPGKRPRSSMTPTFVFDKKGKLYAVVGSPGGSRIIGYVAKTLIGILDWDMTMQEAIDLPNIVNRNGTTEIEPALEHLKPELEAMGHTVAVRDMMSGVNAIRVTWQGYEGGSDKRRIGTSDGE